MRDLDIITELSSELKSEEPISVGGDVEIFITDEMEGKVLCATDFVEGSKHEPIQLSEGVFAHPDNIMLEFGFTQGSTKEEFKFNLARAVSKITEKFDGLSININDKERYTHLSFAPALNIEDSMDELTGYEGFFEVGCDPFMTAYNKKPIEFTPQQLGFFRYGSGHTHVGYSNPSHDKDREIVQNFDFFYLAFLEKLLSESQHRKNTYGIAGALRHKPYGVEYRTPSNAWVKEWSGEMFDIATLSARLAKVGIVVEPAISHNARELSDTTVTNELIKIGKQIKMYNGKEQQQTAAV